jgi:hypothetical protein
LGQFWKFLYRNVEHDGERKDIHRYGRDLQIRQTAYAGRGAVTDQSYEAGGEVP